VRPHVAGGAVALAIDGAIPPAWPVTNVAWHRRLDPIGVASVVALGTGLLFSLPSNGDPLRISLLLKLHEAPLKGAIGPALLITAFLGKPLLPVLLRLAGRGAISLESRTTAIATATIGATLLTDALARPVLALPLDASTFPAVSRVVSWSILGVGLPVLLHIQRLGTARDVACSRRAPGVAQASGLSGPSSGARTHLTRRALPPSTGTRACGEPQAGAAACGQRAANRHPARESTSPAPAEGLSGARNGTPISGTLRRSAAV